MQNEFALILLSKFNRFFSSLYRHVKLNSGAIISFSPSPILVSRTRARISPRTASTKWNFECESAYISIVLKKKEHQIFWLWRFFGARTSNCERKTSQTHSLTPLSLSLSPSRVFIPGLSISSLSSPVAHDAEDGKKKKGNVSRTFEFASDKHPSLSLCPWQNVSNTFDEFSTS